MIIFKFIKRAIYKLFEVTILYLIPLIVVLLISIYLLMSHMEYYSVYYAKHIKHNPNIDPEVIMVMKNLKAIEKPKDDSFVYKYKDFYMSNYKYYKVKKLNKKNHMKDLEPYIEFKNNSGEYEYIEFGNHDRTRYVFDTDYKIRFVKKKDRSDVNLKTVNEKRVKQEMRGILQPIIDAQPEPKVNLQWVFNWMYGDYFK